MSTRAEVETLLDLIRVSALKALDEYEEHGSPAPHLQSTDTHPLDQSGGKIDFMKVIATLEGACEQLCSTLVPPAQTVLNRVQDYHWICMRVAVKHGIVDELAKHDDGLHLKELSAAVNLHPMKLASILRLLATKHCFQEVAPAVFANNRLSMTLTTAHPISAAVLYNSDKHEYVHRLPEYLGDPSIGHSTKTNETAFEYFLADRYPEYTGISFYEWLQLPMNKERNTAFNTAMVSINNALGGLSAVEAYDWSQVSTVCDVGGGIGHFSEALLEAQSQIRVTLFDLPRTIANTKEQWGDKYAGRITFDGGNFFEEVPAKGYDVYYMRNILHNWNDDQATIILKSVRNAMSTHSRLLIHDPVLRPLYRRCGSVDLEPAPTPLLANYGAGYAQLQSSNITMMSLFNTKERYASEIIGIAEGVGLRLRDVHDLALTSMLEFSL